MHIPWDIARIDKRRTHKSFSPSRITVLHSHPQKYIWAYIKCRGASPVRGTSLSFIDHSTLTMKFASKTRPANVIRSVGLNMSFCQQISRRERVLSSWSLLFEEQIGRTESFFSFLSFYKLKTVDPTGVLSEKNWMWILYWFYLFLLFFLGLLFYELKFYTCS